MSGVTKSGTTEYRVPCYNNDLIIKAYKLNGKICICLRDDDDGVEPILIAYTDMPQLFRRLAECMKDGEEL